MAIEAYALTRRFERALAVDGVSLRIPEGAILGLLGPNGAGKTTTVRMLAGLLAPSSGSAVVAGVDVAADPAGVRARSGLVTDVPGLYERMTPEAYLDFFGALYGLGRSQRSTRIGELLSFFDLDAHRRERMVGFSKGMKQKMALARALLHEPAALFLDEPTSGLDPQAAHMVRELTVSLKRSNRSIVLCTHDLDEAERLADEVAIIHRGRVVKIGSPAELRSNASADTLVRIELAAPLPGAETLIGSVQGVSGAMYQADGQEPEIRTVLEYRTSDTRQVNPRVIARLVAEGGQIVSLTCQTSTLEDAYFRVMAEQA